MGWQETSRRVRLDKSLFTHTEPALSLAIIARELLEL